MTEKFIRIMTIILEFLLLAGSLVILALPYGLIVMFPNVSDSIASASAYGIPWMVILLSLLIFNNQVKLISASFGNLLDRAQKLSVAGSQLELARDVRNIAQETVATGPSISPTQGLTYFIKFVGATIYGSQVELLQDLQREPSKSAEILARNFANFEKRRPKDLEYSFDQWLNYMVEADLLHKDESTKEFVVSQLGRTFLEAVENAASRVSFRY